MTRHSYRTITVFYAEQRHRDLIARAEASRLARSVRRRPAWAWLRRGWGLVAGHAQRRMGASAVPRTGVPRAGGPDAPTPAGMRSDDRADMARMGAAGHR